MNHVTGWVTDSGGGHFDVLVARDTEQYPAGRVVTVPASEMAALRRRLEAVAEMIDGEPATFLLDLAAELPR